MKYLLKKYTNKENTFSNRNNHNLKQIQQSDKGTHDVLQENFRLSREQIFTVLSHILAVGKRRKMFIFLTLKCSKLTENYS